MSDRPLRSVDPATGAVLAEHAPMPPARVDALLDVAARTAAAWAATALEDRCAVLTGIAAALRGHRERLAEMATMEMGKTLDEARAEVQKCATAFDHYAAAAPAILAERELASDASRSTVVLQPLGPVLAIMPWNFPYWQVVRFLAPALAAGNVGVVKHAPSTTGCALLLESVLREAGLAEGAMSVLLVLESDVAAVIDDPRIAAVTLTGSTAAGASVAAAAGRAVKKSVLELGGSDPFLVLADADLDAAVRVGVRARFQNCGQSCIAAKRFIVVDDVYAEYRERLVEAVRALRVGDPHGPGVDLGPMARADLREHLEGQVERSVGLGARVLVGGHRAGRAAGWFVAPTVLDGCTADMPVAAEEVFGPVLPLLRVRDEAEAVAVANASEYGLGGNVFTEDLERGRRVALRLVSGGVFVNGMTHSDPRLPFGGVRRSGYGRELAESGLREFTNEKVIWVGPARDPGAPEPAAE